MMSAGRTRILIVDDSPVMRSLLRQVIVRDPMLEVAGTAASGDSVPALVGVLRPDLILLDVEMPGMDGLATLKALRARGERMPVVMCSSLTQRGARVTIEALAAGASDYVTKPAGQPDRAAAVLSLAADLLPRIRALTARRPPAEDPRWTATSLPEGTKHFSSSASALATPELVAIGVSTGGPQALDVLMSELPEDFPLPVLVVQHMPELFTRTLAERLNERCSIRVREAREGDLLSPGSAYVARGNWHMEVRAGVLPGVAVSLHLTQAPAVNHCRPSVDVMLRSAVNVYGAGVLAVQLTGMGADGVEGCRAVYAAGGTVVAQDEATSAVWGMPGAVVRAGLAQRVLPLHSMAREICRIAALAPAAWRTMPEAAVS